MQFLLASMAAARASVPVGPPSDMALVEKNASVLGDTRGTQRTPGPQQQGLFTSTSAAIAAAGAEQEGSHAPHAHPGEEFTQEGNKRGLKRQHGQHQPGLLALHIEFNARAKLVGVLPVSN